MTTSSSTCIYKAVVELQPHDRGRAPRFPCHGATHDLANRGLCGRARPVVESGPQLGSGDHGEEDKGEEAEEVGNHDCGLFEKFPSLGCLFLRRHTKHCVHFSYGHNKLL